MIKAALINGVLWTAALTLLFYFTHKAININNIILIFLLFSVLGAFKYYVKSKRK